MASKITCHTLHKYKGKRKIVALTAYDALIADLADQAEVDLILVGDSVGTTLLGWDTTVPVTLAIIAHHTAAVARAKPNALLVADLPFAEAHRSWDHLLAACTQLVQDAGAEAIKIEGGRSIAKTVNRLVEAGIPVMGHIGLMPQQILKLGRYRKFGSLQKEEEALLADALAIEAAGAFAIVAEMVQQEVATEIAKALTIPLIGIGSGKGCDGQILVSNDLLGLNAGKVPSFVKQYAHLGRQMQNAFSAYVNDVRSGAFPNDE